MGRFYTREMGALVAAGALLGLVIARVAALGTGGTVALSIGSGLTLTLMIGPWLQDTLVGFYAQSGRLSRALDLAIKIRDSAPTRSLRSRASVDLALVQIQAGDPQNALRNLEDARLSDFSSADARAVVQGHLAYCLALTGGDLAKADELARLALKAVPDEGLFSYYLGLVELKRDHASEAEELIADSLKQNTDASAPVAGERSYFLASAQKKLGHEFATEKEKAVRAGGRYAELAREL